MSKTKCKCGHVIVEIDGPCDDMFWVTPDKNMWALVKEFAKAPKSEHPTDDISAGLAVNSFTFLKCPECGRLLFFWDPENPKYRSFLPEPE